jgi:hypothetical protein
MKLVKLNSEKSREDTTDLASSDIVEEFTENVDKVFLFYTSNCYTKIRFQTKKANDI